MQASATQHSLGEHWLNEIPARRLGGLDARG